MKNYDMMSKLFYKALLLILNSYFKKRIKHEYTAVKSLTNTTESLVFNFLLSFKYFLLFLFPTRPK